MFKSRKKLIEELDKTKDELLECETKRDYWLRRASFANSYLSQLKKDNEKLKRELEEQKKIAADHVSLYYDTIQKLKTVMEETNYGKNL